MKSSAYGPPQPPSAGAKGPRLVASIWLPYALGYFLSNALRNINAVLVPELTAEFVLSASDLGLLTSVFFVGFSLTQLPAGILLDRYGSRRVHASLLLLAALGCALHAIGSSFIAIATGRALIGLGLAVGLMGAAKAFTQWFALPRVPLSLNLLMAFGGLGAIMAAGPVGWSLEYVSWRVVFSVAAGLLIFASALLYLVVPEHRDADPEQSLTALAAGFGRIAANGTFWRLSMLMAMIAGTNWALQSLWIGPWLRDVGGYQRPQALALMTWYAGTAVTGLVVSGAICDRLIRRGVRALTLYKIQSGIITILFALIVLLGDKATPIWFAYFLMGSGSPMVLAMLSRQFPPEFAGRVNTAANLLIFSLAFLFQWSVGATLDQWPAVNGRYAAEGYQAIFAVLVALQLAMFLLVALKEKPKAAIGGGAAG